MDHASLEDPLRKLLLCGVAAVALGVAGPVLADSPYEKAPVGKFGCYYGAPDEPFLWAGSDAECQAFRAKVQAERGPNKSIRALQAAERKRAAGPVEPVGPEAKALIARLEEIKGFNWQTYKDFESRNRTTDAWSKAHGWINAELSRCSRESHTLREGKSLAECQAIWRSQHHALTRWSFGSPPKGW